MTDQQKIAIENHCRFAFETALPMFGWVLMNKRGTEIIGSVVLTVNSGYE